MVEVVNVRKCKDFGKREGDVYIGRAGMDFANSPWGNPFPLRHESRRSMVIDQYRVWVLQELQNGRLNLESLKDAKRLGCWCAPKACHGDVLKELLGAKYGNS
jgi:hypothetical protein